MAESKGKMAKGKERASITRHDGTGNMHQRVTREKTRKGSTKSRKGKIVLNKRKRQKEKK